MKKLTEKERIVCCIMDKLSQHINPSTKGGALKVIFGGLFKLTSDELHCLNNLLN